MEFRYVIQTGGNSRSASEQQQNGAVRLTMRYYGMSLQLKSDHRDDVIVEQQHCGGNPVTVYSGKLTPGGEFRFLLKSTDDGDYRLS